MCGSNGHTITSHWFIRFSCSWSFLRHDIGKKGVKGLRCCVQLALSGDERAGQWTSSLLQFRVFFQRKFGTVCEVTPEADASSGRDYIKVAALKMLNDCGLVPVIDAFSILIQVLFHHYFCCFPISVTLFNMCRHWVFLKLGHDIKGIMSSEAQVNHPGFGHVWELNSSNCGLFRGLSLTHKILPEHHLTQVLRGTNFSCPMSNTPDSMLLFFFYIAQGLGLRFHFHFWLPFPSFFILVGDSWKTGWLQLLWGLYSNSKLSLLVLASQHPHALFN